MSAGVGEKGTLPIRLGGAVWIQEVLEEFYKRRLQGGDEELEVTFPGGLEGTLQLSILGYEVNKASSSRDSSLSTTLALKLRYVIQNGVQMIEKRKVVEVKCPPEDKDERELLEIAHVNRREIQFYNVTLPLIQEWVKGLGHKIMVHVPTCYFGRINRSLGKTVTKDIETNFPYAESVLVLEDLEDSGFRRREGTSELSLDEVKAAIHELAKLHAVTWVMAKEGGGEKLFQFGQKQLETAVVYEVLLNKGFRILKVFLEGKENVELILRRIGLMEAKLCGTLVALLEPSHPPAPTTLVHMNSSWRNLVFRPKQLDDFDSEGGKHRLKNSRLDCTLLNWEMWGRGRPTHDLGILLLSSLSVQERQAKTEHLLHYYFQVFKDTSTVLGHHLPFDLNCLRQEYRESRLLGFFFLVASLDLVLGRGPSAEQRLLNIIQELIQEQIL